MPVWSMLLEAVTVSVPGIGMASGILMFNLSEHGTDHVYVNMLALALALVILALALV